MIADQPFCNIADNGEKTESFQERSRIFIFFREESVIT